MAASGRTRASPALVEKYDPDPGRVKEGMRLLGRMAAQAYARDAALPETGEPGDQSWTSVQEERDAAD